MNWDVENVHVDEKVAFLLGSALRNQDTEQFIQIYDSLIPFKLHTEEVARLKERAREISELPESEFNALVLRAKDFSLVNQSVRMSSDKQLTCHSEIPFIDDDVGSSDDGGCDVSTATCTADVSSWTPGGLLALNKPPDDDSGISNSSKTASVGVLVNHTDCDDDESNSDGGRAGIVHYMPLHNEPSSPKFVTLDQFDEAVEMDSDASSHESPREPTDCAEFASATRYTQGEDPHLGDKSHDAIELNLVPHYGSFNRQKAESEDNILKIMYHSSNHPADALSNYIDTSDEESNREHEERMKKPVVKARHEVDSGVAFDLFNTSSFSRAPQASRGVKIEKSVTSADQRDNACDESRPLLNSRFYKADKTFSKDDADSSLSRSHKSESTNDENGNPIEEEVKREKRNKSSEYDLHPNRDFSLRQLSALSDSMNFGSGVYNSSDTNGTSYKTEGTKRIQRKRQKQKKVNLKEDKMKVDQQLLPGYFGDKDLNFIYAKLGVDDNKQQLKPHRKTKVRKNKNDASVTKFQPRVSCEKTDSEMVNVGKKNKMNGPYVPLEEIRIVKNEDIVSVLTQNCDSVTTDVPTELDSNVDSNIEYSETCHSAEEKCTKSIKSSKHNESVTSVKNIDNEVIKLSNKVKPLSLSINDKNYVNKTMTSGNDRFIDLSVPRSQKNTIQKQESLGDKEKIANEVLNANEIDKAKMTTRRITVNNKGTNITTKENITTTRADLPNNKGSFPVDCKGNVPGTAKTSSTNIVKVSTSSHKGNVSTTNKGSSTVSKINKSGDKIDENPKYSTGTNDNSLGSKMNVECTKNIVDEISTNECYIFTDIDICKVDSDSEFCPVVYSKKKKRPSIPPKEPPVIYDRKPRFTRPVRSVTPPPRGATVKSNEPMNDLSPSAFPALSNPPDLESQGRRNSVGDVFTAVQYQGGQDDSDLESVKSLPVSRTRVEVILSPSSVMSYARIAASPRVSSTKTSSRSTADSIPAIPKPVAIEQPSRPAVWKGVAGERRHSIGSHPDALENDKDSVSALLKSGSQDLHAAELVPNERSLIAAQKLEERLNNCSTPTPDAVNEAAILRGQIDPEQLQAGDATRETINKTSCVSNSFIDNDKKRAVKSAKCGLTSNNGRKFNYSVIFLDKRIPEPAPVDITFGFDIDNDIFVDTPVSPSATDVDTRVPVITDISFNDVKETLRGRAPQTANNVDDVKRIPPLNGLVHGTKMALKKTYKTEEFCTGNATHDKSSNCDNLSIISLTDDQSDLKYRTTNNYKYTKPLGRQDKDIHIDNLTRREYSRSSSMQIVSTQLDNVELVDTTDVPKPDSPVDSSLPVSPGSISQKPHSPMTTSLPCSLSMNPVMADFPDASRPSASLAPSAYPTASNSMEEYISVLYGTSAKSDERAPSSIYFKKDKPDMASYNWDEVVRFMKREWERSTSDKKSKSSVMVYNADDPSN